MIKFENVSKTYDGRKYVLNDLNITIDDGEFVFIMGPSGAGKTTLTKLLLREEKLSEGRLYFDKYRLHKLPDRKVPYLRRKMGFVFQDFRLFQNKTVYENVAFAMEVLGEPTRRIKARVPVALEIVGLTGKEKVMPKELSGGEKQRLCVARAIVNNPSVIVADEPTGNLDFRLAKEIMDLLVKISEHNKTVIVVTHAKELVEQYNKRVITIDDGCVISDTIGISSNEFFGDTENTKNIEASAEDNSSVAEPVAEAASTEPSKTEAAGEIFPDDAISEGEGIFNSIVEKFSGTDGDGKYSYDEFGDADGNGIRDIEEGETDGEAAILSRRRASLVKRRDVINERIASLISEGEDADEELKKFRNELKNITADIDAIDAQLGEYGDLGSYEGGDGE